MQFRKGRFEDTAQLRRLWDECFPEDPAFAGFFFERMYAHERARVIEVGGEIAAALYVFPYSIADKDGGVLSAFYIYGVGTKGTARGNGYASELIRAVLKEQCGADVCMLVPQDAGLFEFYKRLGFKPAFGLSRREYTPGGGECVMRRADRTSCQELARIYESALSGKAHVMRDAREWELLADELEPYGGRVYFTDTACVVTDGKGGALEALGEGKCAMLDALGVSYVVAPGDEPYGSAYALSEKGERLLEHGMDVYMNLMHS